MWQIFLFPKFDCRYFLLLFYSNKTFGRETIQLAALPSEFKKNIISPKNQHCNLLDHKYNLLEDIWNTKEVCNKD